MRNGAVLTICLTLAGAAPAGADEPHRWRALSGDRLELDGHIYGLGGVTCPDPATETGRRAKALLNTFLRGGYVICRVAEGQAECAKDGRDAAEGLVAGGVCERRPPPGLPAGANTLVRDTRRAPAGGAGDAACDPVARRDRFLSAARAFTCSEGLPFSLCDGVSGKRQFGRPIARSDRYRSSGEAAPAYRPFDCR